MFKTEKDFGGYWLKNIKSFKGHEQESLTQASVYKDGKKIGFFSEDAWSGPAQLNCDTKEQEESLIKFAMDNDPNSGWSESYHCFILNIAEAIDDINFYKRKCKNKTLIKLKGDGDTSYRELNLHFNAVIKKRLLAKFGDELTTIINEELP